MKTMMQHAQRGAELIRRALLAAASNESLFLFAAFLAAGVLNTELLTWYQEQVSMFERYIVVPWGMALCLLRLERRNRLQNAPLRMDLKVLFVLLAWVVVPYGIRFGLVFTNVANWYGYCAVFFGIYALTSEQTPEVRERRFDLACMLFGLLSLVLGGSLLYCAATGATYDPDMVAHYGTYPGSGFGFGVFAGAHLCAGQHYNITGMVTLCCAMFCFAGIWRSRSKAMRLLYLIAAAMMAAVIVLTQSRTARYALIAAMAVGTYGYVAATDRITRTALRHAAGLAAACIVLVSAYCGASLLTDAALEHYARMQQSGGEIAWTATAYAEETAAAAVAPKEARAAVDATMSGRTDVWKNLLRYWREAPKSLLIGNGVGRTGRLIVEGTIHEEIGGVSIHNTYLQFVADFGLIGTAILCMFVALVLRPVLRVFFARGEKQLPGYRAMCMLLVGGLLTGMMESVTLGAMTPVNMTFFFALALLVSRGREIKNA